MSKQSPPNTVGNVIFMLAVTRKQKTAIKIQSKIIERGNFFLKIISYHRPYIIAVNINFQVLNQPGNNIMTPRTKYNCNVYILRIKCRRFGTTCSNDARAAIPGRHYVATSFRRIETDRVLFARVTQSTRISGLSADTQLSVVLHYAPFTTVVLRFLHPLPGYVYVITWPVGRLAVYYSSLRETIDFTIISVKVSSKRWYFIYR